MPKPVVFMFSGQGSQFHHMGRELYDHHPVFRAWMKKLDAVASQMTGESVLAHIYNEKKTFAHPFDRTLYSHPAIFMVQFSMAQVLLDMNIYPDYVLGMSLGEFVAAAVANILPAETLLAIVIRQAQIFEAHCQPGEMVAVLHNQHMYHETPLLYDNCELASVNFHSHFVISGQKGVMGGIMAYLKRRRIAYLALPVSYAFHSQWIEPAAKAYLPYLREKRCRPPKIPLISCAQSGGIAAVQGEYFWEVVRQPVRFQDTIEDLETSGSHVYVDVGPSATCAGFIKHNLPEASASVSFPIMSIFGTELRYLEKLRAFFDPTNR